MDQEKLDELMQDEDFRTYLEENYVDKKKVDGLKTNKDKILSEKKKIEEKLQENQKIIDNVVSAGYNSIDEVLEELNTLHQKKIEDAEKNNDDDSLKGIYENKLAVQKKTYESTMEKLKKDYENKIAELSSKTEQLNKGWNEDKIVNTFNKEFDRIGILPEYSDILIQAMKGRANVDTDEEGNRIVNILTEDGLKQPAKEYFDMFKDSDKGKLFTKSALNSGGGAAGNRTGRRLGSLERAQKALAEAKTPEQRIAAEMAIHAAKKNKQ